MKSHLELFPLAIAVLLLGGISSAQAQQPPGAPGGPGGGRGFPGFGPPLPREQIEAINSITLELAPETKAIAVASSNLVVLSFSVPKNEAKIVDANEVLKDARLAWALKASSLFAKTQASTNRLGDAAISYLVAAASSVRGGPPGSGNPAGPVGSGGRVGPGGNPDAAMVFTRPTDSPGLGQAMSLPPPDADGFSPMFNGKDLTGWDALPRFWSVRNGALDCVETAEEGGNIQSDLTWIDSKEHPGKYANFELHAKFRWLSRSGNSGIQIRGKMDNAATKHIAGYQADLDPGNAYNGALYDESGAAGRRQNGVGGPHMGPRGYKITYPAGGGSAKAEPLPEDAPTLAALIKPVGGDFNEMVIIANGPQIIVRINGHVFCEVIDEYDSALKSGIIALQQHAGAPMEIQFKDIRIKLLPAKAGNAP